MTCTPSALDSAISGSWKAAKRRDLLSARKASTEACGAMSWLTAITPSWPSSAWASSSFCERRQFLDARRAPARPQIDQHRHALEVGQADVAAVGIIERRRRAPLRPCGCGRRPSRLGLGGRRLALRRLAAFCLSQPASDEQGEEQQDQPHGQLQSDVGRALCGRPGRGDARDQCLDRGRQEAMARGHRRVKGACRDARRAGHLHRRRGGGDRPRASTAIAGEYAAGKLVEDPALEDIHMHVEHRLAELIGPVAGKLHTARSRNDQVATDFKLFVRGCDRRGGGAGSTRSRTRCSTAPRSMRRRSCPASPICSRASR